MAMMNVLMQVSTWDTFWNIIVRTDPWSPFIFGISCEKFAIIPICLSRDQSSPRSFWRGFMSLYLQLPLER